jgi:glycerophosphoryl diester phosphodiesterase
LVIAHRGFSGQAPENTLAAFRMAQAAGADAVELDVTTSKDGEVVVIHDPKVDRTTNGRGKVADLTLKELLALDAGSWFDRRYAEERIPTLEEVLRLLGPTGLLINIEIKKEAALGTEEKVSELVRRAGLLERVVVSSFDHPRVVRVREIAPRLVTAVLVGRASLAGPSLAAAARDAGARMLVAQHRALTLEAVEEARRLGLKVWAYTADSTRDMKRMLGLGVDGIVTNHPDRLRALLQELSGAQGR